MKTKNSNGKIISTITAIILFLILLPVFAVADTIPWDSETYRAYSRAKTTEAYTDPDDPYNILYRTLSNDTDNYYNPPLSLPLASNSYAETYEGLNRVYGSAQSNVSNSLFSISAGGFTYNLRSGFAEANASFTGNFTSIMPIYRFTYDLSKTTTFNAYTNSWIIIDDLTTGSNLMNTALQLGSHSIDISPVYGHNIQMRYGIGAQATPGYKMSASGSSTLSFNTIIVPEPFSYILFVTGGTLLAGRRFIRRKA